MMSRPNFSRESRGWVREVQVREPRGAAGLVEPDAAPRTALATV